MVKGAAYAQPGQEFERVILEFLRTDEKVTDIEEYLGVEPGFWRPITVVGEIGSENGGAEDPELGTFRWDKVIAEMGKSRIWLRLRAPLKNSPSASAALVSKECIPYVFVEK